LTETISGVATQGQTISASCIDATGLTPTAGSVQRTSAAVPNNTLNQDECKTLAFVLNLGSNLVAGDVVKIKAVDQSGTAFAGTVVPLEIEVTDYTAQVR
jgi:hypothetical protein